MQTMFHDVLSLMERVRDWIIVRRERGLRLAWHFMLGALGGLVTAAVLMAFSVEIVMLVTAAPKAAMIVASVGGVVGLVERTSKMHRSIHPRPSSNPMWQRGYDAWSRV